MLKASRVAAAALVLAAVCCGAAHAATLAEAMPPDTLVYVEVPSVPALRAANPDTGWGAILSEGQVRAFLESGFPALANLKRLINDPRWSGFTDLFDLATGQAALAVTASGDMPAAVLVVEVGDNAEEVAAGLDRALAAASEGAGVGVKEEDIPGATLHYLEGPGISPGYAVVGRYIVVSTGPSAAANVARGIRSGLSESLAGSALFTKVKSLAGADRSEILVFADFARFNDIATARMGQAEAAVYRGSGLEGLSALLYTSSQVARGYEDKVYACFADGRTGFFKALTPQSGDYEKYLSMIPSDVLAASWTHLDVAQAYATLRQLLRTAGGGEGLSSFEAELGAVEAEAGVKLGDDIIASLGSNVLSWSPRPSMIMGMALGGGLGQRVALVELADQARFEAALPKIWKAAADMAAARAAEKAASQSLESSAAAPAQRMPGIDFSDVTFVTEAFGDATIYVVRIPLDLNGMKVQLTPAFAVKDGWLVASGSSQGVKNVLGMPANPEPNLLANQDYVSSAKVAGTANAGFQYSDTKAAFDMVYSLMSVALPMLTMQTGGPPPIDLSRMPQAQVISQHLFGSATAVDVGDDFVRLTSYGPVGQARALYAAGVGAAALAAWMREGAQRAPTQGGQVDEEVQTNELATIGMGLFRYARAHGGEYPPSLESLQTEGLLEDQSGDVTIDLAGYAYVPGLNLKSDKRLIIVFAREAGPSGRGVLLAGMNVMNLSDTEVADQVGDWLALPADATDEAKAECCRTNLRTLAGHVRRFAESHNNLTPPSLSSDVYYLFAPLLVDCPLDAGAGPDYAVVPGVDVTKVPVDRQREAVLVYGTRPLYEGKVPAAMLDGTVKEMTPDELDAAIAATKAMAAQ